MKKKLIQALMKCFAVLPLRVQYCNARFIEWIARDVIKYRRAVVAQNIKNSFPEKTEQERKQIEKGFYRHFGRLVAEAVWFGGSSAKRIKRQNIAKITNPEVLKNIYDSSKSVIILLSHNCNWELMGGLHLFAPEDQNCIDESNSVVVYRALTNKMWDEIFAKNRTAPLSKDFKGYVESRWIVRYMFSHANEKKLYFMITDQFPYESQAHPMEVTFMGQKTYTMYAGTLVAKKFGLPVVYLSVTENDRGQYEYTYVPLEQTEPQEIMNEYYRLLEQDIAKKPENYLWSHRRWKKKKL